MPLPILAAILGKAGTAATAAKGAKLAKAAKAAKASKAVKPKLSLSMLADKKVDVYKGTKPIKEKLGAIKEKAGKFMEGAKREKAEFSKPTEANISSPATQSNTPIGTAAVYAEQIHKLKSLK